MLGIVTQGRERLSAKFCSISRETMKEVCVWLKYMKLPFGPGE